MKNKNIVIINGRKYDGITGVPLDVNPKKPEVAVTKDHINHKHLQNIAKKSVKNGVIIARKVGQTMDIARNKSISHFNSKTIPETEKTIISNSTKNNIPSKHPLVAKAESKRQSFRPTNTKSMTAKTAKTLKEEVIAEALKNTVKENKPDKKPMKQSYKISLLMLISVSVISLTGYLIYLFMPSFSVKIASAQAGISATYPEFCPDGYSLSGPVTYTDDGVTINFRANTGDSKFVIKQSKSNLDSSAIKIKAENEADGEVMTTSERGLTIFTYQDNAMWVNGGILYSISGDAPLSGDQVRRIATSL